MIIIKVKYLIMIKMEMSTNEWNKIYNPNCFSDKNNKDLIKVVYLIKNLIIGQKCVNQLIKLLKVLIL